jgi:hypothetical protein
MAIATEASNASQPIVEIISHGAPKDPGNKFDRMIHGTANADANIIHWGLFPVDANLVVSIPGHDRTGEPIRSGSDAQTLKLVIDY